MLAPLLRYAAAVPDRRPQVTARGLVVPQALLSEQRTVQDVHGYAPGVPGTVPGACEETRKVKPGDEEGSTTNEPSQSIDGSSDVTR